MKRVQGMDEQVVWFHGTNSKEVVSEIEREGFQAGTYFAQHMEDAVIFGGAYVNSATAIRYAVAVILE